MQALYGAKTEEVRPKKAYAHCSATAVIKPGESCLYDDDIYAELICDSSGILVNPTCWIWS